MFAAENLSLSFSKDFSCRVRRYLGGLDQAKPLPAVGTVYTDRQTYSYRTKKRGNASFAGFFSF
jgi:hypothetical protein